MNENIMRAMMEGNVKLQYTSLVSGKEKEIIGTLKGNHMVNQNKENPTIVFWDVDNKKYEDIRSDTITGWYRMEVPE